MCANQQTKILQIVSDGQRSELNNGEIDAMEILDDKVCLTMILTE